MKERLIYVGRQLLFWVMAFSVVITFFMWVILWAITGFNVIKWLTRFQDPEWDKFMNDCMISKEENERILGELPNKYGEMKKRDEGLERAQMKDTILTALWALGSMPTERVNLELRRCGFRVGYPETKEMIDEIKADGCLNIENGKIILSN